MEFPQKLKIKLVYGPAIPLLGISLKKMKTLIQKNTCTSMFIAALFTTAKMWKPLKYLLMDEWIKNMWCIYTYIYVYILYMCTHTMAYYMVISSVQLLSRV